MKRGTETRPRWGEKDVNDMDKVVIMHVSRTVN